MYSGLYYWDLGWNGEDGEREMKLTFGQVLGIHVAAEEIAYYCSTVREAQDLPEPIRDMIRATALLAAAKMAERMLVIMK